MTLKSFALDSRAFWLLLSFALCPASQAGRREVPRYLTGEALNYQADSSHYLPESQALALEGRMTVHPCRLARSLGLDLLLEARSFVSVISKASPLWAVRVAILRGLSVVHELGYVGPECLGEPIEVGSESFRRNVDQASLPTTLVATPYLELLRRRAQAEAPIQVERIELYGLTQSQVKLLEAEDLAESVRPVVDLSSWSKIASQVAQEKMPVTETRKWNPLRRNFMHLLESSPVLDPTLPVRVNDDWNLNHPLLQQWTLDWLAVNLARLAAGKETSCAPATGALRAFTLTVRDSDRIPGVKPEENLLLLHWLVFGSRDKLIPCAGELYSVIASNQVQFLGLLLKEPFNGALADDEWRKFIGLPDDRAMEKQLSKSMGVRVKIERHSPGEETSDSRWVSVIRGVGVIEFDRGSIPMRARWVESLNTSGRFSRDTTALLRSISR